MKILINDANVLIDLVKLDLLDEFANLTHELHTTDFILEEVNPDQKSHILPVIDAGKLNLIVTTEVEDFQGIADLLENSSGLSFEDCSAWYFSKKMDGTLVTGDRKLRKAVENDEIEVRGIIFILDEILKQELISFENAIEKIELLYQLNNRLPKTAYSDRMELWKNNKQVGE